MKSLLSGILAAALFFTAVPISVKAEEENPELGETTVKISYETLMSEAKDYWSFDTLTSNKGTTGTLNGNNVSIAESGIPVFGKVLRFGAGTDNCMRLENYINTGADSTSFSLWYRYDTTITGDSQNASAVLLQHEGSGRSILNLKSNGQYHT